MDAYVIVEPDHRPRVRRLKAVVTPTIAAVEEFIGERRQRSLEARDPNVWSCGIPSVARAREWCGITGVPASKALRQRTAANKMIVVERHSVDCTLALVMAVVARGRRPTPRRRVPGRDVTIPRAPCADARADKTARHGLTTTRHGKNYLAQIRARGSQFGFPCAR